MSVVRQSFEQRASLPGTHPLSAYLCELIALKKTNLCLSADVSSSSALIRLADEVGDHICMLKTHADMIDDFSERTAKKLKELALSKKFLIFEDRKFGDIGSTVQRQYTGGPLRIADWAHVVNAHVFPGPAIVTALKQAADKAVLGLSRSVSTEVYTGTPVVSDVGEDGDEEDGDDEGGKQGAKGSRSSSSTAAAAKSANLKIMRKGSIVTTTQIVQTVEHREGRRSPKRLRSPPNESAVEETDPEDIPEPPMTRGLLLLAQMSSKGNLMDDAYTRACVDIARQNKDFVMGFICQQSLNSDEADNFLCLTPGVNLPEVGKEQVTGDALGQQYRTPDKVIIGEGVDVIIVGRGILNAKDRAQEAKRYREEAWKAYKQRAKAQ